MFSKEDYDHGDLEERFEQCRRDGVEGLFQFVEVVNSKREMKFRQLEEIRQIQRRKSQDLGTPEDEQVWAEDAKQRIKETEDRLKHLQEVAINELQYFTEDTY